MIYLFRLECDTEITGVRNFIVCFQHLNNWELHKTIYFEFAFFCELCFRMEQLFIIGGGWQMKARTTPLLGLIK